MIPLATADHASVHEAWRRNTANNLISKNKPSLASDGSMRVPDGRDIGVDIDGLRAAKLMVSQVNMPVNEITSSSAAIIFRAPDAQACPLDFSPADTTLISSFTRVKDAGGERNRKITVSELRPNTVYHNRINCAAQQPTGQFKTK